MFCPQCGSSQSDELKFCKACGENLGVVRQAIETKGAAPGKFDWNKTWVAEMLLSSEESVRRAKEIERLEGKTPEVKRRTEIKAGVITASVGVGLMIVLLTLMEGIILSGRVSDAAAMILSRIWIVGVIPLLVGAALIVNGMFVSRRGEQIDMHRTDSGLKELGQRDPVEFLPPAETNPLSAVPFSVIDETTRHLKEPVEKTKTTKAG